MDGGEIGHGGIRGPTTKRERTIWKNADDLPFVRCLQAFADFDSVFQNLCKKQTRAVRAAVGLFLLALILPSLSCGGETSGGGGGGAGAVPTLIPSR